MYSLPNSFISTLEKPPLIEEKWPPNNDNLKHYEQYPLKLLFLDINGVLITSENRFNLACVENLVDIVNRTRSKVVIISNWKEHNKDKLNRFLYSHPEIPVIWVTPTIDPMQRDLEILAYLFERLLKNWLHSISSFAIIDDYFELFKTSQIIQERLILTDSSKWIIKHTIDETIMTLNRSLNFTDALWIVKEYFSRNWSELWNSNKNN